MKSKAEDNHRSKSYADCGTAGGADIGPVLLLSGNGPVLAGLQSGDGRQLDLQQPGSGVPIDAGDPTVALPAVLQARHSPDASLSQLPVAYVAATERYDLRRRRRRRSRPWVVATAAVSLKEETK